SEAGSRSLGQGTGQELTARAEECELILHHDVHKRPGPIAPDLVDVARVARERHRTGRSDFILQLTHKSLERHPVVDCRAKDDAWQRTARPGRAVLQVREVASVGGRYENLPARPRSKLV